jgi:hypothetical protein
MVKLRELSKYIEDIAGVIPTIKPVPKEALASLPVYLAGAFLIHEVHLFGRSIAMAMPKASEKPNLAQLAKERELLSTKLGKDVALVLSQLESYERRRRVQKKVPFIVPGRQMFLPMLFVDLRESFPTRAAQKDALSWVAQVVLLRHLLRADITGRPLAEVADALAYSAMAITQAVEELVALELGQKTREGRTRIIRFDHAPKILWHKALPHMRSPVKKQYWVHKFNVRKVRLFHAGMTALSEAATIASSPKPILAAASKDIRRAMKEGLIQTSPLEEDAAIQLQAWAYAPASLSEGRSVDPLSLYLSTKDDPDERVQMAIDQLMEVWT